MAARSKKSEPSPHREITAFSDRAYALAKKVVEGSAGEKEKSEAAELASQMPAEAAKLKSIDEGHRPDAQRALSEARLDLSYVAAGGGIPSSIRLGRYIAEHEAENSK